MGQVKASGFSIVLGVGGVGVVVAVDCCFVSGAVVVVVVDVATGVPVEKVCHKLIRSPAGMLYSVATASVRKEVTVSETTADNAFCSGVGVEVITSIEIAWDL